ncbi:hypothetical protein QFZ63_003119 [Streptomyces sp. B3I7]|uniref:tectonin domain-containing protein n=1 Tax=Streptomyces sp. B3I7 TaxID=3042269 RepID=UPI00278AFBB3|nr:tectonin domain-containing protein [Streptomyces sp. B3I7]MDQ0811405.1 hypothetical protein [Streptomyces sp. B3I7]
MADWVKIAGSLTAISAGSRTTVWGVNAVGAIYRYTNHDAKPVAQDPRWAERHRRRGGRHRMGRQQRQPDLPVHR